MERQKNLKDILCELNPKTNLPKHSAIIPKEDQSLDLPNLYCFDSRKSKCIYCLISEPRSYCNYKS